MQQEHFENDGGPTPAKIYFNIDPQIILTLSFKVAFLTVITLGLYRFWGKTRIRQALWSSVQLDGDAFEYSGTGLEKFLGFLIAIVILAVYLGIFQLLLTLAGLGFISSIGGLTDPISLQVSIYLSVLAALPLFYFAAYRARRYQLSRTRWRGIRFGMDQGGWGFAFRAMGYFVLNVLTLGIFSPLMRFKLEKYMTDRSYFGQNKLIQQGKWTELYRAMRQAFIALALIAVSTAVIFFLIDVGGVGVILALIGLGIGSLWLFVGFVSFQVRSNVYLWTQKVLGAGMLLQSQTQGREFEKLQGQMIRRIILGNIGVVFVGGIAFSILAGGGAALMAFMESPFGIALPVFGYLLSFAIFEALNLVWVVVPYFRSVANNLQFSDQRGLEEIQQRDADRRLDAEGFAEALDVGGAI